MLNKFKKFIIEKNLIKPDDRILLAVSGGIDSMVMSHLFLQLENEKGIAHCNFSLRAYESDKDEELVHKFAGEHNIPFYTIKFDTSVFAREEGLSIQMAARELRYKWFEDIMKENGYNLLAVAHNLNDNIETLLINLTRGTGIAGLTGMKPFTNNIIRPLLFATRNDITNYCNNHKIIFREDRSNADTKYTRNKIRHKVIPFLKEINPAIESTLNDTAERFTGINEIVDEYISGLREKISEEKGELITFNISLLKTHLHNPTIIFELFRPFGINNLQLNDLIKVIKGKTGGVIITKSHRIIKNRKEINVSRTEAENKPFYNIKNIQALRKIPGIISAELVDIRDKFKIPSDGSIACLDSDKISYPLIIRNWKPGDHFHPLGMKQNKKLSDYFVDNKYSKLDKENILILESDSEIVWIIGDRIDDRYKLTPLTNKAIIIKAAGGRRQATGEQ
jgi:tRNA(Ile)-lysidine synthase